MGSSLLKFYPSFLQSIRNLDRHLSTLQTPPSWTIEEVLVNSEHAFRINEPEYTQPLCTAVQIALVDLMARWGVKAAATSGHSSGRILTMVPSQFDQ
jgi:acyl transferase domain-containing protein